MLYIEPKKTLSCSPNWNTPQKRFSLKVDYSFVCWRWRMDAEPPLALSVCFASFPKHLSSSSRLPAADCCFRWSGRTSSSSASSPRLITPLKAICVHTLSQSINQIKYELKCNWISSFLEHKNNNSWNEQNNTHLRFKLSRVKRKAANRSSVGGHMNNAYTNNPTLSIVSPTSEFRKFWTTRLLRKRLNTRSIRCSKKLFLLIFYI